MNTRFYAATHPGAVRSGNQDALLCRPELDIYAVADGAGGHENGRAAADRVIAGISAISADCPVSERLVQTRLRLAEAHAGLLRAGRAASTVVVLMLDTSFFVSLWAGDSRLYLWRKGMLTRVTHDHSLVQEMIDAGTLSLEQAACHPKANVITRAIGGKAGDLEIGKRMGGIMPGDRFLLCSDGLTKALTEEEIRRSVGQDGDVASVMLGIALRRKARDNVSLVVVYRD